MCARQGHGVCACPSARGGDRSDAARGRLEERIDTQVLPWYRLQVSGQTVERDQQSTATRRRSIRFHQTDGTIDEDNKRLASSAKDWRSRARTSRRAWCVVATPTCSIYRRRCFRVKICCEIYDIATKRHKNEEFRSPTAADEMLATFRRPGRRQPNEEMFLAMLAAETNTVSPLPTGCNVWRDTVLRRGSEMIRRSRAAKPVYGPLFRRPTIAAGFRIGSAGVRRPGGGLAPRGLRIAAR